MQKIKYEQDNKLYKIISFDSKKMIITVDIYEQEKFLKQEKLPFAHLPKKIKKILNPKK